MKNILESFAVLLVVLLSMTIVFLIVKYNMIEDNSVKEDFSFVTPQHKVTKKEKTKSYLESLEGYGDDTDVNVDVTKESEVNKVVVQSEVRHDVLSEVVEDKSKASYMENLEKYTDVEDKKNRDNDVVKENQEHALDTTLIKRERGEPEKLPEEEIVDEIGMAIDAALEDL